MNKRIYELLTEAGGQYGGENHLTGKTRVYTDDVDYEKFAELIVQECNGVLSDNRFDNVRPTMNIAQAMIKQHFGVDE